MSPHVVIGAPLYDKARWLPEAIESLLAQTYRDFALVLIDDRSHDATVEIARSYADRDSRVHVSVNDRRLGMLENTKRAFTLPRKLFPDAEFWALASDHDVWEPRWLERLVGLLDAHPGAVLAYPLTRRIDEDGVEYERQKPSWRFETTGEAVPRRRVYRAVRGMAAGDMIYGLFRVAPLARVGTYQAVLVPDRLLLAEVAMRGEFVQAEEVLWRRRFRGLASLDRQRGAFWPGGAPAYARVPWWWQHVGLLAWQYAIGGKAGDLGSGRAEGVLLTATYGHATIRHRAWRRRRRVKGRLVRARDAAVGPPVKLALRSSAVRRLVQKRIVPALTGAEEALARLTAEPAGVTVEAPSAPDVHEQPVGR